MCKNADNPCPGCKNHTKPDAAWMFFSEADRAVMEQSRSPGASPDPAGPKP